MMFELDVTKKYGIMLSGGLDSAILLSLIVQDNPSIDMQPFTIPKHDGSALYADNIVDFVNNKCKST